MKTLRCAIYTRKSNEEGLDQAFNSLDAQREAGLDYIKSQRHEGWEVVETRYDDGGYSGGTMKRPGLTRMLDDIDRGRVDIVIVYKVDRLSRSLTDFASMMQRFEERNVSFVSVTQQFNTSTSMGRLTMNMLLSFAQFEREVAGERIRDKIAATKKQGYWVCGQPPLGYRLQREDEERGLYIIEEEANLVRSIFERFTENPSFVEVASQLNQAGQTTKRWTSSTGRRHGGKPFTQKSVHKVLTNPIYIGKVTHTRNGKAEIYQGRHQPIIQTILWKQVQSFISKQDRNTQHQWKHPHLLKGKLFTASGAAMSPSSVQRPLSKKASTQKRQVRYYVSQQAIKHGYASCPIKTINAEHFDDLVRGVVLNHLDHAPLNKQNEQTRDHWIRSVLQRVILGEQSVAIDLLAESITALRHHDFKPVKSESVAPAPCRFTPAIEDRGPTIRLALPIQIKKHDNKRLILSPDGQDLLQHAASEPNESLAKAVAVAHRMHDDLIQSGLSVQAYANQHQLSRAYLDKMLPLTLLGPPVLRSIFDGTISVLITVKDLRHAAKHLDWNRQAEHLGLARSA